MASENTVNESYDKPPAKTLIKVENLSKHFEGLKAVDNVTFSIKEGELVGIIGPNGAGKTTLFNLLTGFLKPEKGASVIFRNKNIAGWSTFKIVKYGIARTFQLIRPFKLLNALENTTVPHIPKHKLKRSSTLKNRATWSLIQVDLAEKKNYPAFILPHGDLKRLDFARSMAVQPKLLLLDEPFAGLSHEEAFRVDRLIREENKKGMTIIIIEHKLKLLMKLVDRVLAFDQGKLIGEGTPKEISKNPAVVTAYLGSEAQNYA
ncbi:MAG: ABC transporter ATP-binding protein [Candidatus Hodarchaeales archaeon]